MFFINKIFVVIVTAILNIKYGIIAMAELKTEEYAVKIARPKSSFDDFLLGLKDSNSEIFKKARNLEDQAHLEAFEIVQYLTDQKNLQQFIMTKEREAEFRKALQLKEEKEKELDRKDFHKIPPSTTDLSKLSVSELTAKIDEQTEKKAKLLVNYQNAKEALAKVDKAIEKNKTEWQSFAKAKNEGLLKGLSNLSSELHIVGPKVSIPANSEQGKAIVAGMLNKEPEKLIDIVFESHMLAEEAKLPKPAPSNIPKAPPPPPNIKKDAPRAKDVVTHVRAMELITLGRQMNGRDDVNMSPKLFMANKDLIKEVQTILKPYAGKEETLFTDNITNFFDKKDATFQIVNTKYEVDRCMMELIKLKDEYQKRTGHSYSPPKLDEKSDATPRLR